jgi:uncharacterized protein (DUF433 family)
MTKSALDAPEGPTIRAVTAERRLIVLGEGVFTVSEVCRILQPTMTPRKVHYWLDTGLLSEPIRWGGRGYPTLLDFRQLLQIRTVQRLRDELEFSLPRVRQAFEWILYHLFDAAREGIRFERIGAELVAVTSTGARMTVPGGQGVLDLDGLTEEVSQTRDAWDARLFPIPAKPQIVSNPRVHGGSPTVRATRVETAVLASFAEGGRYDDQLVHELALLYPRLKRTAIVQALEFEGLQPAA